MTKHTDILQIDAVPNLYRVVSVKSAPMNSGKGMTYEVGLYHDDIQLVVQYNVAHADTRLKVDSLVCVQWKIPPVFINGVIQISGLELLEHPVKGFNIFDAVPTKWVKDRELVAIARQTLEDIPYNLQQLVTSMLWNGGRLHNYCEFPVTLDGPYSQRNGILRKTVMVVEAVKELFPQYPDANLGLSLAAAFLHNIGKAAEFRVSWGNGLVMSDRGGLVSHRHTAIEWLAEAKANDRFVLLERDELALIHILTSAHYAQWPGVMTPQLQEALLLNEAIKLVKQQHYLAEIHKAREVSS
jgi:3'-5' exoribonuclease